MKYPIKLFRNRPHLNMFFSYGGKLVIISPLIDTGCPVTFINYYMLRDKRISLTDLKSCTEKPTSLIGAGGGKVNLAELRGKIKLHFKDENRKLKTLELNKIRIGYPNIMPKTDKRKEDIRDIHPSIIGMDFLKNHNFRFIIDPNGSSYLEEV